MDINYIKPQPSVSVAQEKRTHYRFLMLALITCVLALSTGDRAAMSVTGSDMSKQLGISSVEMGYVFSAFSWAYVVFLIPSGWLTDRIGSKKAMGLAVLTWSIITMIMGVVHWIGFVVPVLLILRFFLGMVESPVGPASGRIIAAWFPASERGVAGAIFNSAQYLSLAVFTPLMGWLAYSFGWEWVFLTMGAIGIVVAMIWFKLYYLPVKHPNISASEIDYMRDGGALVDLEGIRPSAESGSPTTSTLQDIGTLFRGRMLFGIFIAQYCITAITWFFMTWFPIYLVKDRGFDLLQAGFIAAVPAIAGLIGGVSSGFISDKILKKTGSLTIARKVPITVGLILSSTIILCNYVDRAWIVVALMSAAFFGKGFGSLGWTVIADTAPRKLIGTTGGVFNAIGNVAGIVTPVVIGYLLNASGSFDSALLYVGAHGVVAVLSYWLIVGPIRRFQLPGEIDSSSKAA